MEIIEMESFKKHPQNSEIKTKVKESLKYFPELAGQNIYLGVGAFLKKEYGLASCDVENNLLRFTTKELITYVTVFHELMHIVQYQSNIAKTEESCSIHAMARMPDVLVDCDRIPYFGIGNKTLNAALCRDAIAYKNTGKRNYIDFVRRGINKLNCNKI